MRRIPHLQGAVEVGGVGGEIGGRIGGQGDAAECACVIASGGVTMLGRGGLAMTGRMAGAGVSGCNVR